MPGEAQRQAPPMAGLRGGCLKDSAEIFPVLAGLNSEHARARNRRIEAGLLLAAFEGSDHGARI
jgi:hypothetical protein